jgi:four helix bundle protein
MDRPPARRFEDLLVWQKAHAMVLAVYRQTRSFPKDEQFGLVSQMRRAAVSVAANIAEGFKRRSRPDKARLMNIAEGSLEELRYYQILAHDLGYRPEPSLAQAIDEVARMLTAYTDTLLTTR